jgi:hypothetical protein
VELGGHHLLGEVQGVGTRQQREEPPLVEPVVEEQLLVSGEVALNWRRRTAYLVAIVSATLAALIPAPPTHTRPWTRVPSIVKKRLWGLSIEDS